MAITIAGAVSLGSYEAGVLFELLRAVRINNELADKESDENKKIYIDVLTGASAGAMTAAMVAQALMYNGDSLNDEFANPLYQAWVEQISLMALVKMKMSEKKWHSLFSSDLIAGIGHKMLIESMKNPSLKSHPAIEKINQVPEVLRLGMAITNLNGIDYMIPIVGVREGGFNYTSSGDDKRYQMSPAGITEILRGLTRAATWKEVCETAIASGAFPVAFRPTAVDHSVEEYGTRLPEDRKTWVEGQTYVDWGKGGSPRPFAHSDGGVLQNQPLGIAKDLVDAAVQARAARDVMGAEQAHRDSEDRLYVFVAPHSVKSTAEELTAGKISIWDELKVLIGVYTRQAMFHDWITAEGVNQKIRLLDLRAGQLADEIIVNKVTVTTLQNAAQELNALLMPGERLQRLSRLKDQYRVKYAEVEQKCGLAAANAFIEGIATLEAAAQLDDQDKMKIVAVIADEKKDLMGSGLAAFVGFFDKKFRMHDYWIGRVKARKYLLRSDVMSILGITAWPAEAQLNQILSNPSGLKPPVTKLQLIRSGLVPAIIMIVQRPALVLILVALLAVLAVGCWALWHLNQ
jgi:predicted acylesterase/phospholipase RssA